MNDNNLWVSRMNAGQLKLYGAGMAAVGLIFIVLVRQASGLSAVTSNSALFLGLLLLVVGVVTSILDKAQTITVDPQRRLILIESSSRFGKKRKTILFRDIADVTLGEYGDTEGGSISYFIQLRFRNGKEANLFFGWAGETWNRAEMEARRQRLIGYVREPT